MLFREGTGPWEWQRNHEGVAKEQKGIVRVEKGRLSLRRRGCSDLRWIASLIPSKLPMGGQQCHRPPLCKSSYLHFILDFSIHLTLL